MTTSSEDCRDKTHISCPICSQKDEYIVKLEKAVRYACIYITGGNDGSTPFGKKIQSILKGTK